MGQIYTTTIFVDEFNCGLDVLVIPPRSIQRWETLQRDPRDVLLQLGLRPFGVVDRKEAEGALRFILSAGTPGGAYWSPDEARIDAFQHRDIGSFVESIYYKENIPVENSPPKGESLANIAKGASYITLGMGTAGMLVGFHSPWLVIVGPLGVVACGALGGIADGAHLGLRDVVSNRIRRFFGIDEDARDSDR